MSKVDDILVLLERLGRILQNEGHSDGLKPTQWEALRFFERANRFSRSPSALTAYLGMTKGTVSQTIGALERKSLVTKTVDAGDRRQVRIELTASGREFLKHDPLASLAASLSELRPSQRRKLKENLADLLRSGLRKRKGRPFGACKTCRYFRKAVKGGAPHKCGLLNEPLSAADSEMICVEHDAAA